MVFCAVEEICHKHHHVTHLFHLTKLMERPNSAQAPGLIRAESPDCWELAKLNRVKQIEQILVVKSRESREPSVEAKENFAIIVSPGASFTPEPM